MRTYQLVSLSIVALLAVSCGGGSSDSPNEHLTDGSTWIYNYQLTNQQGTSTTTYISEVIGSIINPSGIECKRILSRYADEQESNYTSYSYEDSDGARYYCGDSTDGFIVDSPDNLYLMLSADPYVGEPVDEIPYVQESGFTETCTGSVVAEEEVTVPAGTFAAFKTVEDCSYTSEEGSVVEHIENWSDPVVGDVRTVWNGVLTPASGGASETASYVSELAAVNIVE